MKEAIDWGILDDKLKNIIPKIKSRIDEQEVYDNKFIQCCRCKKKFKRKLLKKIPWRDIAPNMVCENCLKIMIEDKIKLGAYDKRSY